MGQNTLNMTQHFWKEESVEYHRVRLCAQSILNVELKCSKMQGFFCLYHCTDFLPTANEK